jgi:hypothetical protein
MKIVLITAGTLLGSFLLLAAANFVQVLRYRRFLRRSGWNVRPSGRHVISYCEVVGTKIEEVVIDGEILAGKPHHALYILSPSEWDRQYPEWARGRRDEILQRIRSKCPDSEYEYHYRA